jgi:GYF domain 2
MHYQISRNGQMYGPYTLEDLQRYLASGNVLPTDMAKSEEMTDWVPVSQIVAASGPAPGSGLPPSEFTAPVYANPPAPVYGGPPVSYAQPNPVAALAGSPYPDAPNLHWGLYILFTFLTCTFFSKVMTVVQAAWLQRVQPSSKALLSYGAQYGILILTIAVRIMTHSIVQTDVTVNGSPFAAAMSHQNPIVSLLNLIYFIMIFVSRFIMRAALEEHFNTVEPVGLQLNPVMTFFFGGIYFQYHLNRINAMKQAARYGAGRAV